MGRITFTADEQHEAIVEAVADEDGIDSQAEAVRTCIERASELKQARSDHDARLEELQREVERLRNEKRTLIQDRQEKQELVRYAETQRSLEERRAEAGLTTRVRWWLFGMDRDGDPEADAPIET